MPNPVAHFAINADDTDRARGFYEQVFAWTFEAWGPPDFFQISSGEGGLRGALQKRRDLLAGKSIFGFECTLAVDDVDATAKAVVDAGGRIVMDKATIHGVGDLIFFEDTEGNLVGAMQYAAGAMG